MHLWAWFRSGWALSLNFTRKMECLSGLADWQGDLQLHLVSALSDLADRLVMSTRHMAYGFSLGLCMSKLLRSLSFNPGGTEQRQTTDGERETERQTTQVSTPTPAAFLCFTCRWVSRVLTWFAFWTPRSEPSSHQTVNMSLRMWLQGSTSEM